VESMLNTYRWSVCSIASGNNIESCKGSDQSSTVMCNSDRFLSVYAYLVLIRKGRVRNNSRCYLWDRLIWKNENIL